MIDVPIIRLEIESMKHSILHAFANSQHQLGDALKLALDHYCSDDNIKTVVDRETFRVLDRVISEEVRRFYTHGEGREVIRQAVEARLKSGTTWTPLDDSERGEG